MSKGFASNYRVVVLASLVLLSFAGLGVRLYFLHVVDRQVLLDTVEKARRQITVAYARRGDILDTHGRLLATSRSVIDLGVDPEMLRKADERKWPELAALVGMKEEDLGKILNTRFKPGEGGDDEHPIQWAKLSDTVSESTYDAIHKLGIQGIYCNREYRRTYPHNELAAHLIGYVNRAEQPVTGIESFADFYLRGQDGWVESEKDGHQVELAQFRTREVPAADGYTVVLSIDSVVQHMAEAELQHIAEKFHPIKATIIVSEPRTGFILAMANTPSFDLNEYNKLPKDEMNRLRNIAVSDMYEPGSVFKIVAASGALNDGTVSPETTFDCSLESAPVDGVERNLPREFEGEHFGRLSVGEILAHSSNKGAAQIGILMGKQRLYHYVRAFGFGQLTGFPSGGEVAGLVHPPDKWDGLTITRLPIGQSVEVTPIQMHQAMCVIANGGILMRPQIIREIRDPSGQTVFTFGPAQVRRVVTEQTARTMVAMLEKVVEPGGTAEDCQMPGYDVAGKTGTAQKWGAITLPSGRRVERLLAGENVTSFIGFFPANDPQVAISVIVDDPDMRFVGGAASGARVSAPSFKSIASQLIPYRAIQPERAGFNSTAIAMEGGVR